MRGLTNPHIANYSAEFFKDQDRGKIGLALRASTIDGRKLTFNGTEWKEMEDGTYGGVIYLSNFADMRILEELARALKSFGIKIFDDTTKELSSTKTHLEDMRQIVFSKLDIKKPNS